MNRPAAGPRSPARRPPAQRIGPILASLKDAYPDAHCALDHEGPFQLLVATILSAQCTDLRVNLTTPALFARYPDAPALARADQAEVEALIRPTGFFRTKARNLVGMARALVERHGGAVPDAMEALRVLPGVGRKTANVVLGNAFGRNEGITVDTHVTRLATLLGLSRQKDPARIEADLMTLVPREDWTLVSHLLISHGRAVCIARRPRCSECVLRTHCPSAGMPGSR